MTIDSTLADDLKQIIGWQPVHITETEVGLNGKIYYDIDPPMMQHHEFKPVYKIRPIRPNEDEESYTKKVLDKANFKRSESDKFKTIEQIEEYNEATKKEK